MKVIFCIFALFALTASAADAKVRHHRAIVMTASTAAFAAQPLTYDVTAAPGTCYYDCDNYRKALRESGWNPKNNFAPDGTMKQNNY